MVGTTRSRVSHFMNKFRTLGFIDYTSDGAQKRVAGEGAYQLVGAGNAKSE